MTDWCFAIRCCARLQASDVAARGVDYPNVSLVIQLGVPSNRDQYIHRTGRTGRAGKSGKVRQLRHSFGPFLTPFKALNQT